VADVSDPATHERRLLTWRSLLAAKPINATLHGLHPTLGAGNVGDATVELQCLRLDLGALEVSEGPHRIASGQRELTRG
jgi:hypothetical protein